MRYLSVCSGIEAATVAWEPLGWEPVAFAEVAAFPSRVLAHHYPDVPNLGDFTEITDAQVDDLGAVDLAVAGTPCQSYSDAGPRTGLADPRGNLALEFARLVGRVRPRWLVWENVRGVLSSNGGRDFGVILGALAELGYGFAYRVLDAQYFGVPQRRRRVFVVGHSGGAWQRAAAVLLERQSLRRDPPPRRATRADVAGTLRASAGGGVGVVADARAGHLIANTLLARHDRNDPATETSVPVAFHGNQDPVSGEQCPALGTSSDAMSVAVFDEVQITSAENRSRCEPGDPAPTLSRNSRPMVAGPEVRRLTPRERERLMAIPDDYTAIPGASDTARNTALGNSMVTTVMRWIGERIEAVDAIPEAA